MKNISSPGANLFFASLSLAIAGLASSATAQTVQTWMPGGDAIWNLTSANWTPGSTWTQNNNSVFEGSAETVTVGVPITFNDMTFNSSGYLIAGGTLSLATDKASTITVANASDSATISSILADSATGASVLTKAGAGTLTLSGANTYTGGTSIIAGTLALTGSGSITGAAGKAITVNGGAGISAAFTSNVTNGITGAVGIAFGAGSGINSITLSAANDFTGTVNFGNNINNTLTLTSVNAIAQAASINITAGTIKLLSNTNATFNTPGVTGITNNSTIFVGNNGNGANNTVSISGAVTLTANRSLNITGANGYTLGLANVAIGSGATGSYSLNPTTAKVAVSNVTNLSSASGTYTLGLSGTSTGNSVTGSISDGTNGAKTAVAVGATGITSNWTLSGTCDYTGTTTVTNGTLLVDGTHTGGGDYTVAAAGKLGGSGSISATKLSTAAGSKLTPGGDGLAGTLTMSLSDPAGANISASSTTGAYIFDLASTGASDKIVLTLGTLTVGTLDFADFTFNALSGFGAGQYVLFQASSAITGTIGVTSGIINGQTATLAFSGNNIVLNVAAIPEPSTVAMLLLGTVAMVFFARRSMKGRA